MPIHPSRSRGITRLLAYFLTTAVLLLWMGASSVWAQDWQSFGDDIHYDGGDSGNVVVGGDPSTSQPALGSDGGGLHMGIDEKGGTDWGGWSQQIWYHHPVYDDGLGNKINRYWVMQSQDLNPEQHSLSNSTYVSELRVMSSNNWGSGTAFSIIQGKEDQSQVYVKDKMGIGTRTPKNALGVNGIIRSREVIVETSNWPDFVFAPEYDLPELDQVSRFVQKNRHLPGIPTEAEVRDEGQHVGNLQMSLLQKIEELTLYAIERNEEVEALETENAAQDRQIEDLKETVARQQAQMETLKKQVRALAEQVEESGD